MKRLEQEGIGSVSFYTVQESGLGRLGSSLLVFPPGNRMDRNGLEEKQGGNQGGGAALSSGSEVNELGQASALQKLAPQPGARHIQGAVRTEGTGG